MTRLEERVANIEDGAPALRIDMDRLDEAFERRWALWRTRGQAQDEQTLRRMIACTVLAAVGIAAGVAWVAMVG